MGELLQRLDGGELIGLTAVLIGPLIAIVGIVTSQWRRVRLAEIESTLKQQILAKGMSAAEIKEVIRGTAVREEESEEPFFTGNAKADKANLVKVMAEHGMEGEDIERVLLAFHDHTTSDRGNGEKFAVVKTLIENGMEAKDIERVLRAFQPNQEKLHLPDRERIVSRNLS